MKIAIDYTWLGKVENEIRDSDYILRDINYAEGVQLYVLVVKAEQHAFTDWMTELTSGQAVISFEGEQFLEFIRL